MRVVSVANQKGGVGKTTVAVNLASALARLGREVLLIDNDPQGHATAGLGVEPAHFGLSTRDLYLDGGVKVQDVRIEVAPQLHLVPADLDLSTIEQDLADQPRKLRRLLERLAVSEMPYEIVLIDNPPQIGLLTFNALLASSEALLPVDASRFAVEAVQRFDATLRGLEQERGHRPRLRIVPCGFDLRTRYARRILEDIDALQPGRRVHTLIRVTIRLREAAQAGLPIDRFDPGCHGAEDFAALAREFESGDWALKEEELLEWEELLYGPGPKSAGVHFRAFFPHAEKVCVTGDFTGWSVEGIEMQPEGDGHWRCEIEIPPGCYEYKFIVDGEWTPDPGNPEQICNAYGQLNSVLTVPEREVH